MHNHHSCNALRVRWPNGVQDRCRLLPALRAISSPSPAIAHAERGVPWRSQGVAGKRSVSPQPAHPVARVPPRYLKGARTLPVKSPNSGLPKGLQRGKGTDTALPADAALDKLRPLQPGQQATDLASRSNHHAPGKPPTSKLREQQTNEAQVSDQRSLSRYGRFANLAHEQQQQRNRSRRQRASLGIRELRDTRESEAPTMSQSSKVAAATSREKTKKESSARALINRSVTNKTGNWKRATEYLAMAAEGGLMEVCMYVCMYVCVFQCEYVHGARMLVGVEGHLFYFSTLSHSLALTRVCRRKNGLR